MDKNVAIHSFFCIYFIGEIMNLSDLQNKDIINVIDGKKIGNIIDAKFNISTGVIEKIIIEPSKGVFSIKNNSLEISFNAIKKIGEDVILIDYLTK